MRYYPIFLDVGGRRVLVVGGGKVAERKVRKLLAAGAKVRVISPALTPRLAAWAMGRKISVTRRRYRQGDIPAGAHRDAPLLVFAATDDSTTQQAVRNDAQAAGVLTNDVSDPARCDFIVPASFTHDDLHVAISTSGTDPALARLVRQRLSVEMKKIKSQRSKVKSQK